MTRGLRILLLGAAASCATLGTSGQGDLELPSAGVGPFRKLADAEEHGVAPMLFDAPLARYREPALLRDDNDLRSMRVTLFAVASVSGHDAIVRSRANDGRSFFAGAGDAPGRAPALALAADAPWENGSLSGPSALRVGEAIYLYYASNGAIGLARSARGASFTKLPAPVFSPPRSARAPAVAQLPDGSFRLLYESAGSIFEAASADGIVWADLDADEATLAVDPVLGPASQPATLAPGERPPFDTDSVGDPCVALRVTPAGRLHMRVLYTGRSQAEGGDLASAIGFAARYGSAGRLSRNPSPVLSLGRHEQAPALLEWLAGEPGGPDAPNRSLLLVALDQRAQALAPPYSALAGAVAPATVTLDAPAAFADAP